MKAKESSMLAALLLVTSALPASADALNDWLTGDYATGDWGGVRTDLEEMGITPEAAYTTDILAVRNGNEGSGDGWDYAGRIDFGINFDLEKLFGLPGFSLYASGAWSSGHDLSGRQVGNIFAVQQIFTGREARLSQLYVQQDLLDDRLTFKLGRLTAEADFLASDIYANYVNGGINGVPSNIPDGNDGFTTAPFSQWGLVAAGEPIENLRVAVGIYNVNEDQVDDRRNGTDFKLDTGDGVLAIAEVGYSWNQAEESEQETAADEAGQPIAGGLPEPRGGMPGNAKVGILYQSGDREDIKDGGDKNGNPGFYVSAE
ncbi:MAG: carbohydrate porin, partial [Rhodospirillales bacterium]|nr:carbohydrate porin [Rhodospirillales bacterium]